MNRFERCRRRLAPGAAVLVVAATLTPSVLAQTDTETDLQTVAAAALSGYDALIGDVRFVGELAGYPGAADMAEGMLAMATQGRGLAGMGLDTTRPLGVVLQTDGSNFAPMACLPLADTEPLMEMLEAFQLDYDELGDGVVQLEMPEQTVYFKQMGEWTYVAQSPDAFDSAPADPLPILSELVSEYDLGIKAFVQKVPPMYRQVALNALRSGMEQGLEQEDEESDEDYQQRVEMAEAQIDQLSNLIEEVEEFTVGWNLDAQSESTYLDIVITAAPDTDMAAALAVYDDTSNSFAGFWDATAAAGFVGSSKSAPEVIEKQRSQLEAQVKVFRTQMERGIEDQEEFSSPEDKEKLKAAANDLMDAYQALLLDGRGNMAGSVTLDEETGLSVKAGGYVPTPEKLESALKNAVAVLESKPDFPGIEWDADEHAGIRFHLLSAPLPPEAAAATPLLGDKIEVAFGFADQAVYMGVGNDAIAQIKSAFDDSRARDGEETPPFEFFVSLGQMIEAAMPMADADARPIMQLVMDAIEEQPEGTDHVRISGEEIEQGVRIRYLAESGVLKAAAAAAAAAQAQAAGGGF